MPFEHTPLLDSSPRVVDVRPIRQRILQPLKSSIQNPLGPLTYRSIVWHVLHYRSSVQHVSFIQKCSYYVELFLLNLIVVNVVVTVLSSSNLVDPSVPVETPWWFTMIIYVSTVIFTTEYALRLWSCIEDSRFKFHGVFGRLKWMIRPMSLIDLISLIPYFIEIALSSTTSSSMTFRGSMTIRGLRLLRVISFLRIERSYDAIKRLRIVFRKKRQEFFVITYLTAVVILVSATIIFFLEFPSQPEVFSSIGVSAWWAIETITSLGYGDTVPVTPAGRIFASIVALWGIILFAIPGAILGSGFIEVMLEHQNAKELRVKDRWIHEISSQIQSVAAGSVLGPVTSTNIGYASEISRKVDISTIDEPEFLPTPMEMPTPNSFTDTSTPIASPYGSDVVSVSASQLDELMKNQEMMALQIQLQREQLDSILRLLQERSIV
ncbi:Voltage-gated Ion Channel (VIC) Superfamily [Thraustotheca clavata]|uniref:Voltage-gated Ion Channel (VIC) Superfamily n=1 Tax=Thraustotheca clavata TaxID=74557 RepID=A0A1W0A8P9_9STRA|nr:Voltage-gated Ion Channel (VIC) Superfamily [Thraustotheca clavata]